MLKGKLNFFDNEIYTIWLMKFIKCFFGKYCYFKVIMEYGRLETKGGLGKGNILNFLYVRILGQPRRWNPDRFFTLRVFQSISKQLLISM